VAAPFALVVVAASALSQEPAHPLKPPDRSSPRAALKAFLDSADALVAFMAEEYVQTPTRSNFARMVAMGAIPIHCLDPADAASVRHPGGLTDPRTRDTPAPKARRFAGGDAEDGSWHSSAPSPGAAISSTQAYALNAAPLVRTPAWSSLKPITPAACT